MPDWIKEWALTELRELTRAKTAAALLAMLAFGVGWLAARKYDADTVALMQLRAENAERGIARPPEPAAVIGPNGLLIMGFSLAVGVGAAMLASAIRNKRIVAEIEDEAEALRGLLKAGVAECQRVTDERDKAVVALKDKKQQYAMEVLEAYSTIRFKDNVKPTVTIRYCHYTGDDELALKLKGLFTQYVKWAVTLDGSNNPALPRAEKFKVVFDVGMTVQTYGRLVHAFTEGDLLGVSVGVLQFNEREDTGHLVVLVLPSPIE